VKSDTLAYKKSQALILLLICVLYLSGCVTGPVTPVHKGEVWKGTVTGMVTGEVEIVFSRGEPSGGGHEGSVYGTMKGELEKVAGGHGPCSLNCKIEGTIKNDIMNTNLGGTANCPEYTAGLRGTLTGTISGSHGQGAWTLIEQALNLTFSGEWSAEKTDRQ
jgi:hypothetical protein